MHCSLGIVWDDTVPRRKILATHRMSSSVAVSIYSSESHSGHQSSLWLPHNLCGGNKTLTRQNAESVRSSKWLYAQSWGLALWSQLCGWDELRPILGTLSLKVSLQADEDLPLFPTCFLPRAHPIQIWKVAPTYLKSTWGGAYSPYPLLGP